MRKHLRTSTLVALVIPLAILVVPPPASAGSFGVLMCSPSPSPTGVGPAQFERGGAQARFNIDQGCISGGAMRVRDTAARQSRGQQGVWRIGNPVPANLAPQGVRFLASGRADKGLWPYIEAKRRGGGWVRIAGDSKLPPGQFKSFTPSGPFEALRARLVCQRRGGCGSNANAHVKLRRVRFDLFDGHAPAVPQFSDTSSIVQWPVQRSTQTVGAQTSDPQTGIDVVTLHVNGRQHRTLRGSCADGGRDALGRVSLGLWRPCLQVVTPDSADTRTSPPFREGMNSIRLCASDFAGNSRCSDWRQVRVDNRCPIAPSGDTAIAPARLAATFARGGRNVRGRFPARPRLSARLVDNAGDPLPTNTASLCVTERVAIASRPRTSVAPPAIPSGGTLGLPPGPNRILWLNYWLDSQRVLTRRLRVRMRPQLNLRRSPRGTLRNGQTMRVRARLRGPFRARRKVIFHVVTAGRTFRLGATRTNRKGIARVSHPFRDVRSPAQIRVRATVPKQRGYPFLKGRSKGITVKLAP